MEFKTNSQKVCYQKVKTWMTELFGEMAYAHEDIPSFAMGLGSAAVHVSVFPWGNDDATITSRSYVVRSVEMTPDLMQFLLRENDTMRFGAFGIDADNDIFFEHTIVGSSADRLELKASVLAVISTADSYDDKIIGRWGGKRARD